MNYPERIEGLEDQINRFAKYKTEMGSVGIDEKMEEIKNLLHEKISELATMAEDPLRSEEPSKLEEIQAASPSGTVTFDRILSDDEYLMERINKSRTNIVSASGVYGAWQSLLPTWRLLRR